MFKGCSSKWIQCDPRRLGRFSNRECNVEHATKHGKSWKKSLFRRFENKDLCWGIHRPHTRINKCARFCQAHGYCYWSHCRKAGNQTKVLFINWQCESKVHPCSSSIWNFAHCRSLNQQQFLPATLPHFLLQTSQSIPSVSIDFAVFISSTPSQSWSYWKWSEFLKQATKLLKLRWISEQNWARLA